MNNSNRTTHQKDVSLKTFWRDNEHFADLFNATVFNGKQVLKPDKLTEMDTDVSATIHPIITLVLYYGESLWDGPTCLSDMMISMPDNIKAYFSDYKLNLVQILDSDKYTFYNEDVRDVFNIIRNIYNDDFDSIYREYESRNVDIDVMELICNITSVPKLMDLCTDTLKRI